jgi:hypothetical protein
VIAPRSSMPDQVNSTDIPCAAMSAIPAMVRSVGSLNSLNKFDFAVTRRLCTVMQIIIALQQ